MHAKHSADKRESKADFSGVSQVAGSLLPKLPRHTVTSAFSAELFRMLECGIGNSLFTLKTESEKELRYFCLLDRLERKLDLTSLPHKLVEQHYFESRLIPIVSWFTFRALGMSDRWNKTLITRARVRRITEDNGAKHCTLEIKGPKRDFERLDVGIPISGELYTRLIPLTDGSALAKDRYELSGLAKNKYPAQVHIDVIRAVADPDKFTAPGTILLQKAASGRSPASLEPVRFAIIEVEVDDRRAIDALLNGKHDMKFLGQAIALWKCKGKVQNPLSTYALSHAGTVEELGKAVDTLRQLAA